MSVPPDVMQALQGGGGGMPPQGGGGGLPPEIMQAMMGGGGAPPQGGEEGGEQPSMSGDGGSPGGSDSFIRDAIDLLAQAAQAEADEQDILTIQECMTNLQKVLANNQKDADSMMGGKASPAGMRKAAGAIGG